MWDMFLRTNFAGFVSQSALGILFISGFFLLPTTVGAAVLYENDFSSDPHWLTDDSDSFHWDEARGALYARAQNGPRGAVPDRYFVIPTQLDPTKSFTLTWRQMIASSTNSIGVPFGILPEHAIRASSTSLFGGIVQGLYGTFRGIPYHSFFVYNKSAIESGQSGTGGGGYTLGRWYLGTITYDADVRRLTYLLVDTTTNTVALRSERNTYSDLVFGPPMQYIGLSMYAISLNGTVSAEYPDDYAEAFFDDVKLENTEPESPTEALPSLSFSSSTPYDGVRGVSPEKGIPNETVFTFSTVYTSADNSAPTAIVAMVGSTTHVMLRDASASTTLHDSNYANGETYVATTTIPNAGTTTYFFSASNSTGTTTLAGATAITTGYSNIAFLPGVKSTYLYKEGSLFEDQLWLPNPGAGGNDDISHLYMNQDGTSAENGIYTKEGDIIKSAYNLSPVYQGFPEAMDALVADGTIAAWKPISYDWRLDYADILSRGKKTGDTISYLQATDTPYVVDELRKLADSSKSGKVSIIAHSNGGLLAKALLADLEARHDPLLEKIDLVVLVAVPQLGTPKTLFSMLHGAENELNGMYTIVNDSYMRRASQYMPTAFNLLPSEKYYTETASAGYGPIIQFSPTLDALVETIRYRDVLGYTGTNANLGSVVDYRSRYGADIDGAFELNEYLRGAEGRPAPAFGDVEHPALLPQSLLTKTQGVHALQDSWTPPDRNADGVPDIKVVQIAGFGIGTIRGVEYGVKKNIPACLGGNINTCIDLYGVHASPVMSGDGDGTVMFPSATVMAVESYYINLNAYNNAKIDPDGVTRDHASLIAATPVAHILAALVGHNSTANIPYVIQATPTIGNLLVIEMHSPVALDVYDSTGGHLGSTTDVATGISYIESTIPNATHFTVGESVYIMLDPTSTSTVKLDGLGAGTFTLKIKKYAGNTLTSTTTYSDVPVTNTLLGQFNIGPSASVPSLSLDTNGDGAADETIVPDGVPIVTPQSLLGDFRTALAPMVMPLPIKNTLILLSKTTEQLIAAKKIPLSKLSVASMEYIIKEKTNKGIVKSDADKLLAILTKVKTLLK